MTSLRSSLKWGRLSHVGVWICSTLIYRASIIFSHTLSLLIKSSLLVKSPWLNRKSVVWFWNILTTTTNKARPVRWWSCWASLRIASPSRPHSLAAQNHRGWRWCDRCLGGLIQFAGYMIHIHKTIKTKVCMEKDGKSICEKLWKLQYYIIYIYTNKCWINECMVCGDWCQLAVYDTSGKSPCGGASLWVYGCSVRHSCGSQMSLDEPR